MLVEIEELYFVKQNFMVEKPNEISTFSESDEIIKTDEKLEIGLCVMSIGRQEQNGLPNARSFMVAATFTWLKNPTARFIDAFSVYADGEFRPAVGNTHLTVAAIECDEFYAGTKKISSELTGEVQSGNGVSVVVPMRDYKNNSQKVYKNFVSYMVWEFYIPVNDNADRQVRLWPKYVHSWLGLSYGVGWDIGAELPGVSLGVSWQTTQYGFGADLNIMGDNVNLVLV